MHLTPTRIHAGFWEGVLTGCDTMPDIAVHHLAKPLEDVRVIEQPDAPKDFLLRVAIPPETIADGVQTYVITDRETGDKLASFAILAGQPLSEDFRAELDLLRAELDMLKKAFRRHCVETA